MDPSTGTYNTTIPSPTGIASDPALASYGVEQAEQLAEKIITLEPPVDVVYSSPFYRCLQTLKPTIKKLDEEGRLKGENSKVRVDNGIRCVCSSATRGDRAVQAREAQALKPGLEARNQTW